MSASTCTTSIVRKKITSIFPCEVTLKPAVAMGKQENMPCECPIAGCSANPWVLNIKTLLVQCRPTVPPNALGLTHWVRLRRDDEKKMERAKKSLK